MLNKILIFFSVLFFFPSYLWYFKIKILLGAGRPNDFSAPWFIGYQISIHRHMPLFSCCWWPPTSGKEMTKCYLAIQQRICCMQFKWNKNKIRLHTDSICMDIENDIWFILDFRYWGKWKANVTRPEYFQNPIIKSGEKYAKSISLPHILEMTAQSPDLVQFL